MIDTLVIGGGSIKTIASLGALNVLKEKGILDNIIKYAGSSAGSVIVTLLILGYTPNEINDLIFSKIGDYTSDSFYKIPINMIYNYGIYTGNNMIKFLEGFFEKKCFKKDITFKELHKRTSKVLVITGTSLSSRDTLYFNYQTTPDMSVIKAIRISSSIPLYFTSVKHLHKNKEHLMCDGGLLCNFPLYYFDHLKKTENTIQETVPQQLKLANTSNGNDILYDSFNELHKKHIETRKIFKGTSKSSTVIGILLLEQYENRDTDNFYTGFKIITNLKEYITSFIETMLKKIEQDNFLNPLTGTKKNFFNDTITIQIPPEINIVKLNLTASENKLLYDLGVKGANEFFDETI